MRFFFFCVHEKSSVQNPLKSGFYTFVQFLRLVYAEMKSATFVACLEMYYCEQSYCNYVVTPVQFGLTQNN